MRIFIVAALLLAAVPVSATELSDYAWAWPLEAAEPGGAAIVELTPEILAAPRDPSLRDLEAFDAAGRPLPMAPWRPPALPLEDRIALPVFAVERALDAADWDLRLRVERGPAGALRQVAARLEEQGPSLTDYLLDASGVEAPIASLILAWSDPAGATRGRYAVEASDDLEHWTQLVAAASVVDLRQGDASLVRREIRLPGRHATYLRLRALDPGTLPALGVEALVRRPALAALPRWVEANWSSTGEPGVHLYELAAPFIVEAVRIETRGTESFSEITVGSRLPGKQEAWLERARFTAFRIAQAGTLVLQEEKELGAGPRALLLRIETKPALVEPPRLFLAARPERYAVLLQGEAPFRLAAGSSTARRVDAPVEEALAELRSRLGPAWEPPQARLGPRFTLAGEEALEEPRDWARWLLWLVLAGGAALVGLLALRLLRGGIEPQD